MNSLLRCEFPRCAVSNCNRGEKFFPFPLLSIIMMNIFHRPVLINMKLARNAETIVFLQHNHNNLAYDLFYTTLFNKDGLCLLVWREV